MARSRRDEQLSHRPGLGTWWAVVVVGAMLVVATGRGPLGVFTWRQPTVFFWSVVIAAGLCAIGATAVLFIARRTKLAELGILGGTLWVTSVLPLVHGLTAPGYLYGANSATAIAVFLSLPLGSLCALPLLVPGTPWAIRVARRWSRWVLAWMGVALGIGALLLLQPRRFSAPQLASPASLTVAAVSVSVFLALSLLQLRLYWIGRRRASLWASLGIVSIAVADLVWVDTHQYSASWWLAHAMDTVGVLFALVFLVIGPRPTRRVSEILAPVLARDPLSAFALGISPVVHHFVAALEKKDETTRDHVVRVGELAMRTGARARIPARRLRALGLGALLHDIGKLAIPEEILKAPRHLSVDEFEIIKRHPLIGEAILRNAPELALAAPLVRWHHERFDGTGYPDGIQGDVLPIEAGIISVIDAFDAMTNSRHYRDGTAVDHAIAILHEHSGTQWDPRCVDLVVDAVLEAGMDRGPLWTTGRMVTSDQNREPVCIDALPDAAQGLVLAPVSPAS